MRTLLVDNYDSFTYNLFQQLADVNGAEPVVIRNDEPLPDLRRFDNIVLSPGPGRPERAADLGVCRSLVENADLPVLGVCLGHQGICQVLGGRVSNAPEVRHGQLSSVLHDGSGLFAGLPSPFQVVRYHSLVVDKLPAELEAIAWTVDGILMGVRHRERPVWGVQFHPESVCTEYGRQLMANFRDLTRRWRRRRRRILVETLDMQVCAEVVFDRLFRPSEHSFWLDSSLPGDDLGRFSFMGDACGPLARVVRADVWAGTVTVTSASGTETVRGRFLDWLDADLAGHRAEAPELPFGFSLGWVGYLGYELKAECGGQLRHRSAQPDATMIFPDHALAFDHAAGLCYLLALAEGPEEAAARQWLAGTAAVLAELAGQPPPGPEPPQPLPEVTLRHDRARYLDLICACLSAIREGESYEVCLTNVASAAGTIDPWRAYRFLRQASPAPFAALLRLADLSVLSTSPERFLSVSGDGVIESRPIKGTRRRGVTPAEDELLREDLAASEKDRAENLMIVDLVRSDLGRCAEVGSVHVPELFDVQTYATAHQLVSTVRARLKPGHSTVDVVRAAFPGGSMTGAPKIRTMRIIDELEAGPRGVYSGAIGYFSLNGAADLSIVIRTLIVTPGRAEYGTGGAVTALSDPAGEFDETAVKAAPLLRLLNTGFPG